MEIRKATSLDLPAIAALHLELTKEIRALAPAGFGAPLDDMPGAGEVAGKFRDGIDDSDCLLLVAEENGKFAGLASAWVEEHGDDMFEAPFMTVEFVEVHPDHRGRGIAQQLIEALEAEAARRGFKHIDLLVMHTNEPARSLYEKLGYQPIEVRMGKVLS